MHRPATRQTIAYFGGHVALGLMSAVLGPTIPALAAQIGREPEALGVLFAVRSLGYLLASAVVGPIYDRGRGHAILVAALAAIALGLVAIPFAPNRLALIGLLGFLGLAQGTLDVGNNLLLTRVHGARVGPYMTALHCAYGVGALIAPLVVAASGTLMSGYAWLAAAMLPIAAWVAASPGPSPRTPAARAAGTSEAHHARGVLGWMLAWFLLAQGAESGFSGWLFTVATESGLGETEASRLLSGFWATFTGGRLLAILVAARVDPPRLLLAALGLALTSAAALLAFDGHGVLVAASLGLGLALAPVFPVSLAWAAARLELDGSTTGKLFVGASVGSMLVPWLLGHSLVLGPRGPVALVLVDLVLAALVFARLRVSRSAPARG